MLCVSRLVSVRRRFFFFLKKKKLEGRRTIFLGFDAGASVEEMEGRHEKKRKKRMARLQENVLEQLTWLGHPASGGRGALASKFMSQSRPLVCRLTVEASEEGISRFAYDGGGGGVPLNRCDKNCEREAPCYCYRR